jgi:hypothetical protein
VKGSFVASICGQTVWREARLFGGVFVLSLLLWLLVPSTAAAFISGTLYTNAGTTTAPTGITIGIAVGTSTNTVYTVTTTAGGAWSLTGVGTSSLSSTTPITVWLDASTTDATTLVMGYSGTNITNVPLYYNDVVVSAAATSSTVTLSSFINYDRDQDSDILFVTATSATSTVLFEDLFITRGTLRLPELNTVLIGSYTNNATLTPSVGNFLTLAGTSETVSGSVTGISALGNVRVTGSYTTPANASTTSVVIESGGSFTAPSNILSVTNSLYNSGTFTNNSGTVVAGSIGLEISDLQGGRESGTTTGGSDITAFTILGTTLYVGRVSYSGACVATTGSGCELLVYDVSSTTNPVFRSGLEASTVSLGGIRALNTASSTLYVGLENDSGACVTTTGASCELRVYDVSSTTNPVFVTGRESGLTTNGSVINDLTILGTTLYVGRFSYSSNCTTTTGANCELLIYDISSTTNPVLLGGRESGLTFNGATINTLTTVGTTLYVGRNFYTGACVTTTGDGCELLVYNVSSTTNPIFIAGRETGVGTNGTNTRSLSTVGNTLYVGREAYTGACVTGTGEFCELLIYDISSTTNPVLLGGRESELTTAGTAINDLTVLGTTLYVGRSYSGSLIACTTNTGADCELLIYDISSTTNPVLIGGRESAPTTAGATINTLTTVGTTLYVGRILSSLACVTTTGASCELLIYNTNVPTFLTSTLTGSNSLNNVTTNGLVLLAISSTSVLTIGVGTTTTTGTHLSASGFTNSGVFSSQTLQELTVSSGGFTNSGVFSGQSLQNLTISSGGFTNSGVFSGQSLQNLTISSGNYTNNGTTSFSTQNTTVRLTGVNQTLSGTLSNTSPLPNVHLLGSGTKTFANNATTTDLLINGGVTMDAPSILTVTSDFQNNGTYNDGNLLEISAFIGEYLTGRESGVASSGTQVNALTKIGSTLYVGRAAYTGACVTTTGNGCELLVYDVSSTSNPVFMTGREAGTTTTGSNINNLTVVGTSLYVGRDSYTGACVTTTGNGCELLVYDVSSTTDPVFRTGREAGTTSTGSNILDIITVGTTLYVGRLSYTGACVTGTGEFCELLIYNVSSTTDPVLLGGRESGLTTAGATINTLTTASGTLYVGRLSYTGACVTGTGDGCELLIYNVSSTTDPVFVAGRGTPGPGNTDATRLAVLGTTLYYGRTSPGGVCSTGIGDNCELLIYNVSSTTDPVLIGGRETGLTSLGGTVRSLRVVDNQFLYVGRIVYSSVCSVATGAGCELLIYNISSTTNPVLLGGREGGDDVRALINGSTTFYVGLLSSVGTCVPATGSGCELMVLDTIDTVSGTLTGVSALGNVRVAAGAISFTNSASTTNFTNESVFLAPTALSVAGNYTNIGTFTHGSGTVALTGVTQQTATGTLTDTSAFHNLTIRNTSGNGNTSQSVVFSTPIQTTGTFAMSASTSASFLASATSTFAAVNWTGGGTTTPVWLRSSANGTQWRFTTNNFVSTSFVNVRDSFNGASSTVPCTVGCTDGGNNTNWPFASSSPVSGTLTLAAHPSGQATNLFSFQNQDDGLLYRFAMTAATETAIVDDVVLSLFGLRGVDTSEVTDLRLYRDVNSDGALDGGDTQVLGAGIMAIQGESGTITFSSGTTNVATTTAQRYIVTADTVAIDNNDWMNIELRSTGITATGLTSGQATAIAGSVSSVQHIRSNAGGGGVNRSPIGGDAPAGAGQQGGGGSGAGGNNAEAGQLPEGANISPDPDFSRPTTNGSPHNEWTNGANAYNSDGVYTTSNTASQRQTYGGFGFAIPTTNTIQGIQVKLDGSGTTAAGTIQVGLSWDDGTTITTLEATPTLSGSDIVYNLGGQTNLWGRTWTATELNNTFRLRIVAQPNSNTVRLDAIEVRVYHTAGGGGQGGGVGGGAI